MSDWSRRDQSPPPPPERHEAREPAPDDGSNRGNDRDRPGDATMTAATTKGSSERTTPVRGPDGGDKRREPRGGGTNWGAVLAALVLGLLLGGFAMTLLADDTDDAGTDQFAGAIADDRYQAVILSNDKVYFGRIESVSDEFYRLDNAFFLRETRESAEAEPQRALLPINREIHAPENSMLIRKDEVVLVENLDEASPIQAEIERQLGDE
jgi:hypothetical protein